MAVHVPQEEPAEGNPRPLASSSPIAAACGPAVGFGQQGTPAGVSAERLLDPKRELYRGYGGLARTIGKAKTGQE